MKILVLSDSHRSISNMEEAVIRENPDRVIHLGDHHDDAEKLESLFPMLPIAKVYGNCDFCFDREPLEKVMELGGKRILYMHGHTRGVKSSVGGARYAALECGADIVLFGHTHQPFNEEYDGLHMLNPGSIGRGLGTYGLITIENGTIRCEIKMSHSGRG